MTKPQWPGIATAVGLLLILTICVAASQDSNFQIKDWQPTIAAIVATFAAIFTYRAAMAKVITDRSAIDEELARERLGVMLRLRANLFLARTYAANALKHINEDEAHETSGMSLDGLGDTNHFDFEEPWGQLHFFPTTMALKIANLRVNLSGLRTSVKEHTGQIIRADHIAQVKHMLVRTQKTVSELEDWVKKELPPG